MKRLILILGGLVLMVGFQNCAKVGTDNLSLDRSDKFGSVLVVDDDTDNSDGSNNVVGEDVGNSLPPVVISDDDDDVAPPLSDDDNDSNDSDDPALLCADLLKGNQSKKLVVGLNSIVDERGAMYVSSSQIALIDNYRGKLLVIGSEDGSRVSIDRIHNNGGRLILCNADVAELSKSNGRIDLHNSTIEACEGKVGNIKMDADSSVPADCGHNIKTVALKH